MLYIIACEILDYIVWSDWPQLQNINYLREPNQVKLQTYKYVTK